jgi:hypothetical protein
MRRHSTIFRSAGFCLSTAFLLAVGTFGTAITAAAQSFEDLQTTKSPLVLKGQGSFYMGGEVKLSEPGDLGDGRPAAHFTVNQMYVEYMIPQGGTKVPVVMVHGGGLSGKSYETTPDGRMGWDEYFVRQGHAVYNVDQAARARSGHDVTLFNRVRQGILPPTAQPSMNRQSDEGAWTGFRFGPTPGVPFPDTQFPVEAADEFSKQATTTLNVLLPVPDSNFKALSDLAIKLKGAVIMGHSQSGFFPVEAVLTDSTGIKGAIVLESGGCNTSAPFYTDAQIAKLATVPILVEFNDHLDADPSRVAGFNNCNAFIARINAAGGNAQMLWPPALGIHGNTHMVMLDKNNLQIADLILKWIDEHVGKQKVAKK